MRPKLLLLVALVLAGSACSSLADPPALTVNGAEISAESIDRELNAIEDNESYRRVAENDCQRPAAGQGEGTFDSACVAHLLSLRAYYELMEQELEERGREITEEELLEAREDVEIDLTPQGESESLLDSFGRDLQDQLVRRYALIAAVREEVGADEPDAAAQQAFYEENVAQFEQACASHVLASTDTQSPEEAQATIEDIAARIAAGEDFGTIAATENDDAEAAAAAGSIGCGPRGSFLAAFDEQVFSLPVGQLSAPVQTELGWHLILVTARETPTFEQLQVQIEQTLRQQASTALGELLSEITCDADVSVDPRFGRWDTEGCRSETGDIARVVPPEGPITTDTSVVPLP